MLFFFSVYVSVNSTQTDGGEEKNQLNSDTTKNLKTRSSAAGVTTCLLFHKCNAKLVNSATNLLTTYGFLKTN